MNVDELKHAGNRYLVASDYANAEKAFREAIAADADRADLYIGLAKVLDRTDRFEEIVALLEPVYSRFESAQLLQLLGDAHRVLAERGKSEHVDIAIRRYNELHLRRRDPVTLAFLGFLLADHRKDFAGAYRAFRASWDLDPGSLIAYQAAIRMLNKLGRTDEVPELKKLWRERADERRQKRGARK